MVLKCSSTYFAKRKKKKVKYKSNLNVKDDRGVVVEKGEHFLGGGENNFSLH